MVWLAVGVALTFAAAWALVSSTILTKAIRDPITTIPRTFGLAFEDVALSAKDGVPLAGWWVPAAAPSASTIVVCHGWGANRSDVLPSTHFLNSRGGHNLFYLDFRGHGESGDALSSLTTAEGWDLEAALDLLRARWPDRCRRLGLFGTSMGASVAIGVAARRKEVLAVAAVSPFSTFNGVVFRYGRLFYHTPPFPLGYFTLWTIRLRLGYDPEKNAPLHHVGAIAPRPLFLIQGDHDARMPVSEGESLFAKAGEPKTLWTIPGADHGEAAERAGAEYQERLLAFFRKPLSE